MQSHRSIRIFLNPHVGPTRQEPTQRVPPLLITFERRSHPHKGKVGSSHRQQQTKQVRQLEA
ncbi:MAG: hypothetical protein RIS56_756, partial [Verrucomicrobiota bacterium]